MNKKIKQKCMEWLEELLGSDYIYQLTFKHSEFFPLNVIEKHMQEVLKFKSKWLEEVIDNCIKLRIIEKRECVRFED